MSDAFLERYAGQSTDELLALADRYRIDSLVLAFEDALLRKAGPLSREESYIVAIEALEREVNNGGYTQFFDNTDNQHDHIVVEALRAAGCGKTAAITAHAIDHQDDDEELSRCDQRYYDNDEPIAERLFAWIGANRARVRVP